MFWMRWNYFLSERESAKGLVRELIILVLTPFFLLLFYSYCNFVYQQNGNVEILCLFLKVVIVFWYGSFPWKANN